MNAPRLEARRWFQEAQADLAVVRTLRGAGHHAAACFYSQQAAESHIFHRYSFVLCGAISCTGGQRGGF